MLHARLDGINIKLRETGNLILLVVLVFLNSAGFANYADYASFDVGHRPWLALSWEGGEAINQGDNARGFQTATNTFRSGDAWWNPSGGTLAGGRFRPLDGGAALSAGEQAKDFRPVQEETEEFGTVYPGQGAGDLRLHRQFRPLEQRSKSYEELELEAEARKRLPSYMSPYPVEPLPGSGLPGGFRPQW